MNDLLTAGERNSVIATCRAILADSTATTEQKLNALISILQTQGLF